MNAEYDSTSNQDKEREVDENKYFLAKGQAATYLKENQVETTPPERLQSLPSGSVHSENTSELSLAIQQLITHQATLSQMITNLPTQSTSNDTNTNAAAPASISHQEVKLRPIDNPTFNGNYKYWTEFHDLYKIMIHNNQKLSPCEKLQYL